MLRSEVKKARREIKKQSKGTFARVGANLGGILGASYGQANLGRSFGGFIGRGLSRATGFGDYEVRSNSLVAPTVVPDFGPNSVRITHKEYLGNVDGSTKFEYRQYPLNPGMATTFPWLSGIARNYQQYRMNGVIFQYVSTSAFALGTTNSALGKVILATNYNAEDPSFTSTVGMLATQFSNYCRPADSIQHAIECAPTETANNVYYVRTDLDGTGKDLRLTDIGFTEIATEGMQSSSEVGGLWITYDITLMKPILNPQNAMSDGFDQFVMMSNNDSLVDSKQTVRNGYLGGTLSFDDGKMIYYFNEGISSGYFLSVIEFDTTTENKITHTSPGSGFHTYNNAGIVLDSDKDGPFNAFSIGGGGAICSNLTFPPYTVGGTAAEAIIVEVFLVNGPEPWIRLQNVQLAGVGISWRWSIFPLSYNSNPQVPIS
jgi:hypothetical protein